MARTAVVAGTATAVSNRVSRRQAQRWSQDDQGYSQPAPQQYAQPQYADPQYAQPQYAQPQYAQPQYAQPAPPPAPASTESVVDQLTKLAALHDQGVLSDDEFGALKAKIVAG